MELWKNIKDFKFRLTCLLTGRFARAKKSNTPVLQFSWKLTMLAQN